jgi:hypothetical protein
VPRLRNLRELSVSTDKLTHEGVSALLHLPDLARLDLANCVALGDRVYYSSALGKNRAIAN